MWHYNFDYLSHGMNGYKYIDKYRGKNGKWNYVYEGQKAREKGVAKSKQTTRNLILNKLAEEARKNPITGPSKYYNYLRTGKVPENKSSNTAKPISTRKSEIRQKVDPAIDQKAREREIAKGKAAAKDYRQSKVTAAEVQRERERAIKEGMSSNRQWDRDRVSKGSSVEAAQKAREQGITSSKAATKRYDTSQGAKKNAELAKILGNMINETKSDIKKNVHANFKTNEAQRGRAEDINKSVEAAREAQRKKENSLGARIKRNIDNDIATAKALNNSKAKSPKEIIKSNAKDIVEGKVNSMSKEERAAKQQEREHSRTTAAIDAQNARQRAIEASQARQRQAAAAKQQEEERKQAGNRSVERAQNAREAAIAKSVQATEYYNVAKQAAKGKRKSSGEAEKAQEYRYNLENRAGKITQEANQAKQVANAAKQQEADRRMSGSTKRENALRDDVYISELLNKELGLPSSSGHGKSLMETRNAYAKVYQTIKNDPKIASSTKDEFKEILDYLTEEYEKTRDKNTKTWDDVDRETTAAERKKTRTW